MTFLLASDNKYCIGLDLGQARDPTAIAGVCKADTGECGKELYRVGYLERLPLQTTYPGVVSHVEKLLNRSPFLRAELVVDATGVGRPVVDLLVLAGLNPVPVTIVAGDVEGQEGRHYRVPKLHLVSRLQALLHDGRLQIQNSLPEAATLKNELMAFKATVSETTGIWRFGARSGQHDDLVLALALAVWRLHGKLSGWMQYYRELGGGMTVRT